MTLNILQLLKGAIMTSLNFRIMTEWEKQHPGVKPDAGIAMNFTPAVLQDVSLGLARDVNRAVEDFVDMAEAYCHNTHEQVGKQGCTVKHCPFFIHPEDVIRSGRRG